MEQRQDSTGLIELQIGSVEEMFHAMDPSPFARRDLDSEAEAFIVGWAMEHAANVSLVLKVHVREAVSADMERTLQEAIRNYFSYKRNVTVRGLRAMMKRAWIDLMIGLTFLAVCLGGADLARRMGTAPIYQIANYSFIIAGWVAMSGPLEIFLYKWWPVRQEKSVYERLSGAKVVLATSEKGSSGI